MASRSLALRACVPDFVRTHLCRRLASSLALALACVAPATASAATPDLAVLQLVGPVTAHVGMLNYVTLDIWNIDDAYAGAYQVELLLSTDDAYDASDTVVSTVNTSAFSTQIALFTIPASLPGGSYWWIARVLPVAGETSTANNLYVGLPVNVLATDLALVDPSEVVFHSEFQEPAQLEAEVEVENAGNAGSILLFTTEMLTAASWLKVDVGDGFAIEGKPPAQVTLTCDSTGLPIGSYVTTVRFHNASNPADYEDLAVRLEVGNQVIVLGDRIRGQIGEPGETDEVRFDGLAGTKLALKGHVLAGGLKLIVTLFAPSGGVEHVLNYKNTHVKVTKVVTLAESGQYRMVFSGKGTTTGSFRIKTYRHHPSLGKARNETVTAGVGGTAALPVQMYLGAKFDCSVQPGAAFAGPVTLTLLDPDGNATDLSGVLLPDGDSLKVESFAAAKLGEWQVVVGGFGPAPGADATVLLYPVQPPKGDAKVYVP